MAETPTIESSKAGNTRANAAQLLQQETSLKHWDTLRNSNNPINYQWGSTMDGVQNVGGVNVMNFVPVRVAEKNSKDETVYRYVRMTHQEAAKHTEQKKQEQKETAAEVTTQTKQPESQPAEKLPIQKSLLDKVLEYIGGSSALQFFKGVGAGILEWFADIILGIGALLKAAFAGNIAAIAAIGGLVVVAILACFFPEVVLPVLMVVGGLAGLISGGANLIKMMNPFISAYEKGKYLGKAIVDGLLLILSVAEIIRFVKVYAQVAKFAAGASLLEQLRFVKAVKGIKDITKIISLLSNSNDITKTLRILDKVKEVDKVIELLALEKDQQKILILLEEKGVTYEQVLEILKPKSFAGLKYYESLGGHTIALHVGKTDAELITRLSSTRISASSSFTDLSIAERVVSKTIADNGPKIAQWLQDGAKGNLSIKFNGTEVVGRGILRGQNAVNDMKNAIVVLKNDKNGGYFVLTAYPKF